MVVDVIIPADVPVVNPVTDGPDTAVYPTFFSLNLYMGHTNVKEGNLDI